MENNNEKRIKLTFNKKVISISFLALALFMLLAVSYAYFTATVTGNDEAKKTTLTTGTMSLKLTGPTEVTTKENMIPGESVSIEFKVENTGTVATYYNLDMIEVTNTFNPKSDLVYSVKSDKGANKENTIAPSDKGTLIPNIRIEKGETHSYTLTITFLETHSNQNSNQGKTFTGRVQINNIDGNSLATTILNNNPIQTETVDFLNGSPKEDGSYNGNGLFATEDDDGPSYYFRGEVDNNYVSFAKKTWRILRINGDGTIRLMLVGSITGNSEFNQTDGNAKYVGYTYDNSHPCTVNNPCISDYQNNDFTSNYGDKKTKDSIIKGTLETWYKTNLTTYDQSIALTNYCNDTSMTINKLSATVFKTFQRGGVDGAPSLKCPDPTDVDGKIHNYGGAYKLKIGLITSDELEMAGITVIQIFPSQKNYLYTNNDTSWTLSPEMESRGSFFMYLICGDSSVYTERGYTGLFPSAIPVINLNADVTFNGDGTESSPYTIE